MKLLVVAFAVLVSSVLSAPQHSAPEENHSQSQSQSHGGSQNSVQIVRYFYDHRGLDGYKFTYELSDGQIRSEEGAYKDGIDVDGNPVKILVVQGAYTWIAPDGETYWVNYQSDENGYRPTTGKGVGGIKPGEDAGIDPNLLKSLVG